MAIADSLNTIAENVPKVYEAGKKAERDAFWDNYQNYGKRQSYSYAFAGDSWRKTGLLPPKYKMVLSAGATTNLGIFKQFRNQVGEEQTRYDMAEICKLLNASQGTVLSEMFMDSYVENVTLDLSSCTTATSMFNCGMRGGNIDNIYLKVTTKLKSVNYMFNACYKLKTIRFTEDSVIAVSLSLLFSPLSKESIENVINTLSTSATGKTLTLNKNAVNKAFETAEGANDGESSEEWENLIATKSNWTITLSIPK